MANPIIIATGGRTNLKPCLFKGPEDAAQTCDGADADAWLDALVGYNALALARLAEAKARAAKGKSWTLAAATAEAQLAPVADFIANNVKAFYPTFVGICVQHCQTCAAAAATFTQFAKPAPTRSSGGGWIAAIAGVVVLSTFVAVASSRRK